MLITMMSERIYRKFKNILENTKNLKLYLLKFKQYSKYKLNIILKRMMIYNLHWQMQKENLIWKSMQQIQMNMRQQ